MKRVSTKLLLFLSPFLLLSLLILSVDPYNLYNLVTIIKPETKTECLNRTDATAPRGFILWKTIDYQAKPVPNILLGTSRMIAISNESLSNYFSKEAKNLAVDGANYRVIADLFWMAADATKLENVIIQADFNTYDAFNNYDLYGPVNRVLNPRTNYFFSMDIISDTFALLYYAVSQDESFVQRSYRFRTDLFEGTEKNLQKGPTDKYRYPKKYYEELLRISEFCQENNINLVFVIAPDYYEVADYRKLHSQEQDYKRFVADIYSLGKTINLNNGLGFSNVRENFMDHYHVRLDLADTLLSMIFSADSMNVIFNK